MLKKAVLFDMDGVLIDSEPVYAQCLSMAFAARGVHIPPEAFYPLAGLEFREKFQLIIRERGLQLNADELAAPYREAQAQMLTDFGPMLRPGAIPLLRWLRDSGCSIALCSNSNQERVSKVFHDTGMDGLFDVVVTGELVPKRKPDPGVYLMGLDLLGLPPEQCVAVEDSTFGIQAAKQAGLTVTVFRDPRFPIRAEEADRTIDSLPQLKQIWEELQ